MQIYVYLGSPKISGEFCPFSSPRHRERHLYIRVAYCISSWLMSLYHLSQVIEGVSDEFSSALRRLFDPCRLWHKSLACLAIGESVRLAPGLSEVVSEQLCSHRTPTSTSLLLHRATATRPLAKTSYSFQKAATQGVKKRRTSSCHRQRVLQR